MAPIYLGVGKFEMAKKRFSLALEHVHITRNNRESNDHDLVRLLRGLAAACKQTGKFSKAVDALQSALKTAESLYGHISGDATEIYSELKSVRERIAIERDHRKRVLIASTGGKRRGQDNHSSSTSSATSMDSWTIDRLLEDEADIGAPLSGLAAAAFRGEESVVKLLLEKGADVNAQIGSYYVSALAAAALRGKESIVKLLLENGADVNMSISGVYGSALVSLLSGDL